MKKAINRVLEGVANTTERWAGIQSASSLRGEKRRLDKKANTARKKAKSSTEKQDARWSGEDSDVNAAGYDSEDFAKARTVHGPLFLNSQDSTLDDVFSDESMSDFDPELGFDEDDDGITIRRRDLANRTLSDAAERAKMKPKKKNRMGQARRRLLHEQEYGREARHLQTAVLDKVRKKAKISASVQAEENLHPSWAAKRAPNRTSLEAFAGKKVVFDDDGDTIQRSKDWEEDTPSVTSKPLASVSKALGARWPSATSSVTPIDEGLHPSWAAKRREAEIAARGGAGTKIVFF
ncbi:hypothetical protein DFJ73DRAFT_441049 [Zopfochytrium polystomum]|nr:hypothetical protein DFJ73DRAFT_441049 [Zopfochytrium polystomum]